MQQMVFDLLAVRPVSVFGSIKDAYRPFRSQADILMEGDGAWAFGETAERCLMRLAGKTVLLESQADGVAIPFRLHPNRSMVGWGPGGYGRIVIPDEVVGRAYVGRFGVKNMTDVKGRPSTYALTVIAERALEYPDLDAQAEILERVRKGGEDLRALYRLRGGYVALEWRPRDPLVKKVQSQYLLVESVSLRAGRVRFSGPGWHAAFSGITGWAPAEFGIFLLTKGNIAVRVYLTHSMCFLAG